MNRKRVFKTKQFARWAKKVVDDLRLCEAAREIELGRFEADLGGGICKKRIALPGKGKSGSTRTLVAIRHKEALIFIVGREKRQPGGDFSDKEIEAAKLVAKQLHLASEAILDAMNADGLLEEICNGKDEEGQ
ncbi:MAG: type II toxin-antitoxin system RelE/ParE family toxin [Terriglobales bacterium]